MQNSWIVAFVITISAYPAAAAAASGDAPLKVEWVAVLERPPNLAATAESAATRSFLEGDFAARASRVGLSMAKKERVEGTGKTLMLFVDFNGRRDETRSQNAIFGDAEEEEDDSKSIDVIDEFFYEEAARLSDPTLIDDLTRYPGGDRIEAEYEGLDPGQPERGGIRLSYFKNVPISAGPGFVMDAEARPDRGVIEEEEEVQSEIKKRWEGNGGCKRVENVWGLDRIDQRDLPLDGLFCRKHHDDGGGTANEKEKEREFHLFVLDTGIDDVDGRGNPHFDAGATVEYDYSHYDRDGVHFCDCNGHGTHVSGSAASYAYGVLGWGRGDGGNNNNIKLRSVKILDCDGYGDLFSLTAGLLRVEEVLEREEEKAVRRGNANLLSKPMGVVNLSLGAKLGRGRTVDAVEDIMRRLWQRYGILFVVSAGNHGQDACEVFPANVMEDFVLTVGSTTPTDERSYFSNYGRCVDVYAPGSHTLSLANVFGRSYYEKRSSSTTETTIMSGTSMSAGYVSGAYLHWLSELYELPSYSKDHGGETKSGEEYWATFVADFKRTSFVKNKITDGSLRTAGEDGNDRLLSIPKKSVKMRWKDYRKQKDDAEEEEEEEEDEEYDGEGRMKWWTPFSTLFSLGSSRCNDFNWILWTLIAIGQMIYFRC